jgi:hypothetical protein
MNDPWFVPVLDDDAGDSFIDRDIKASLKQVHCAGARRAADYESSCHVFPRIPTGRCDVLARADCTRDASPKRGPEVDLHSCRVQGGRLRLERYRQVREAATSWRSIYHAISAPLRASMPSRYNRVFGLRVFPDNSLAHRMAEPANAAS